jgi:hypothetical protein
VATYAPQGNAAATAIACPSASQCTTVDYLGREVTFDPTNPGTPVPHVVEVGAYFTAVDCPSTEQCTAVNIAGEAVTFDPTAPALGTPAPLDSSGPPPHYPSDSESLTTIACPSTSQCTTLNVAGREITFNPGSPGTPASVPVDGANKLYGLTCVSAHECIGVGQAGSEVTFNPTAPGASTPATIATVDLDRVVCPLASECVAVGDQGSEVTFDPADPAAAMPGRVSQLSFGLGMLACPSAHLCITGDERQVISTHFAIDEWTFDPTDLSGETAHTNPASGAMDCPTSSQCTAMLDSGETTFDPSGSSTPSTAVVDTVGVLAGLACPSDSQCTSLAQILTGPCCGASNGFSFDPAHAGSPTEFNITGGIGRLFALACPLTNECIGLTGNWEVSFDPTSASSPVGQQVADISEPLACPSSSECVAGDDSGGVFAFDPTASASPGPVTVANVFSLACPSTHQCTGLDPSGDAVSFDPTSPGSATSTPIASGTPFGIVCPSVHQCSAIEDVDADTAPFVVGHVLTFDPGSPGNPTDVVVDTGHELESIACPSIDDCVAVDDAGRALEGDPSGDSWSATQVPNADGPENVACSSPSQCVATDDVGSAFVGTDSSRPTGRPPQVVTGATSNVTAKSATLSGSINPQAVLVTDCALDWGTDTTYKQGTAVPCDQSAGSGTSNIPVSAELTGLTPGTTYHYRFVAENTEGIAYGGDRTFTTPTEAPDVTTGGVGNSAATTATLTGAVDPNGAQVTDCDLEWGTGADYAQGTPIPCGQSLGAGSDTVDVTAELTGLTPGTTYHYRFAAENADGRSYGADATFTTPIQAPSVVTGAATDVATTTATVSGAVNPNDLAVSYCAVQWGTSTSYTQGNPVACEQSAGGGIDPVAVTAQLTGLAPTTTYHYRFVADNSVGRAYGADQTLRTGIGSPPPRSRTTIHVTARLVHGKIRLVIQLRTTTGRPLAAQPLTIVNGSRKFTTRTGPNGYVRRTLASTHGWTLKVSYAGTPAYAPATARLSIRHPRRHR